MDIVLQGITCATGLGFAVSRQCSAKAVKHKAVHVLASVKPNTVQFYNTKTLEEGKISDKEYLPITNEVEK